MANTIPAGAGGDWSALFNQAYGNLGSVYGEREAKLNQSRDLEKGALDAQNKAAMDMLQKVRDEAYRQAYIGREQNRVGMHEALRAQGLSGGMAESSAARLMRGYQGARNNASNQYSADATTQNVNYTTSLSSLLARYSQQLDALMAERRNEAYNWANSLWQAQLAAQQAGKGGGGGGLEREPKEPAKDKITYGVGLGTGGVGTLPYRYPKSMYRDKQGRSVTVWSDGTTTYT